MIKVGDDSWITESLLSQLFCTKRICLIAMLCLGLVVLSCEQERIVLDDIATEANRNYSFAGPLGNLHITMSDFLEEYDNDSTIVEHEDGTLYYAFSDTYPFEIDNAYALEDVNYIWQFEPVSFASMSNVQLKSASESYVFEEQIIMNNEEGVRLDSIFIGNADLNMHVSAPSALNADVTISLPEVLKDGQPLLASFKIGEEAGTNTYRLNENLSDYIIGLTKTEEVPSGFVRFVITFDNVSVNASGGLVSNLDPVNVSFNISDIEPDIAFGSFGEKAIDTQELVLKFDGFEKFDVDATIEFGDLLVDFKAESSIGVPFDLSIGNFTFQDTQTDISKQLVLETNSFSVESATYGNPIIPVESGLSINGQNSNILDLQFGTFQPNIITGEIVASILNEESEQVNFISQLSEINAVVDVKVPLWLKSSRYSRIDTIDFDYNAEMGSDDEEDDFTDNFDSATLNLGIKNAFPFELQMQAYVLDEEYVIVDSLFKEGAISILSPEVDADGFVMGSVQSDFVTELNHEQVEKFRDRDVKYIFIKTGALTAESGQKLVKVQKSNYYDISLAVELKGSVE